MKLLAIIFATLLSLSAMANYCSDWTETRGVSCIFNGRSANIYERQCENPCWMGTNGRGNWGPTCDLEKICSPVAPSSFQGQCSDWYQDRSVTCRNPNTSRWESKWTRACTVGLKTEWCSNDRPDFLL